MGHTSVNKAKISRGARTSKKEGRDPSIKLPTLIQQNKLPPNFYAASVQSKLAVSEEYQRT